MLNGATQPPTAWTHAQFLFGRLEGANQTLSLEGTQERLVGRLSDLDDEILDTFGSSLTFASHAARLPDLGLGELPEWLELHVRVGELSLFRRSKKPRKGPRLGQVDMRAVGIQNEEQKVIAEVRTYVREHPAADPTLVLFFSDGGVDRNKEIEKELREAVEEPIFWQFVGLGRSNYGVLERFDTLPVRRVDSVGFFAVDDISSVPDAKLYDRLLSEFSGLDDRGPATRHHLTEPFRVTRRAIRRHWAGHRLTAPGQRAFGRVVTGRVWAYVTHRFGPAPHRRGPRFLPAPGRHPRT